MSEGSWRHRGLVALLALTAPLTGCDHDRPGSAPASPGTNPEAAGFRYLERYTGGARASDTLPLVVVLHGRGGRPELVAHLLQDFEGRARVILPCGPEVHEDGFAWYPDADGFAEGSRRTAARLATMIEEIARSRPTAGKPIVMGFSQGAILSYTLAVLHPNLVRAAFPVAGMLPKPLWPAEWPAGTPKPQIHALHGAADPVLSIDTDRATVAHLRGIGLPIELTEYPGAGHVYGPKMQRDVARALEQALGGR
jgi:phospholipase/carboxylesterase